MEKSESLAANINKQASNILFEIAIFKGKIDPSDYKILKQSCIKIMEVTIKLQSPVYAYNQ